MDLQRPYGEFLGMKSPFARQFAFVVLITGLVGIFAESASAQATAVTVSGTSYTQNFDGITTGSSSSIPAGWSFWRSGTSSVQPNYLTSGSNTTAVTQFAGTVGTGVVNSSSGGGAYLWISGTRDSGTDKSIGFLSTGSYPGTTSAAPGQSLAILFGFTNTTGGTITNLDLGWNFERYREGTRAQGWEFYTSTDGSTWSANTAGNESYTGTTTSTVYNPPQQVAKSVTIPSLSIQNGSSYYLRWSYVTTGSWTNAQGLGLDDFTMNLTTSGSVADPNLYWDGAGGWSPSGPGNGGSGSWADGSGSWNAANKASFDGTAGTVTIAGGGVTADNGISFLADGYTVSGGPLTLGATSNEIAVAADVSATISAPIAGNNGITKTSPGTLILGGANTFSGSVTVAGGTLQIGVSEALGVRPVTINGGILAFDATPRTVSNAITFAGNGGLTGVLTLDGEVSFGNATRTVTVGEGSSVTLSGSYGSGGIAKAGAGTLQLNANASLTALGMTAGTMQIAEGVEVTTSSQPSVAGGTLAVNGTLRINSASTSIAPVGVVSVGATGVVIQQGNGSLTNLLFSGTAPSWAPGSTLIFRDFTLTPSVSNRTYGMNLVYESSGTTMNVGAISGAGAWTVQGDLTIGENVNFDYGSYSGNLTYSGDVIVGGVLGATTGARSFTIGSGKQLRLENAGTLNIAAGQTVTISGSVRTTATAGQNATIAGGSLSLGGGTRIVEVAAGTGSAGLTISSVVTDGSLTKTGAGVLRLTGSNTYEGETDVTAGGLVIDGTVAGLVAVAEDAFIGGAGTIGGNLAFASGAQFLFDVSTTLTVNGSAVTFGDFGITDLIGFSAAIPDGSYTLIDGLADIDTTNLRNLGFGNRVVLGGGRSAYFTEGSLVLNVVPEPSAVVLAGLGGLLAAGYAVRRRR